jgi:O-antigen/teichoic acid export membrane protein
LNKDIISYGFVTAIAKGIQFLMLPILTRLFSPSEYGIIDLLATVMGLVTILMSLSLESAIARMWHEAEDHDQRKKLLASVMFFIAAFGTVVFLMVWGTSNLLPRAITGLYDLESILPVAIGTALLLSIASAPQMALRMERRIFRFGVLQVANAALGIIIALSMIIYLDMGLLGLFLGYLVAAALVLGLSIYWTRNYLEYRVSYPDLKKCLKFSLPMVPAVFLSWADGQVDRVILLFMLGLGVVGIYGAAAKIVMLIVVLVGVFRLAWLPIALGRINEPSRNSYFRSSLIGYLTVFTCLGLILVAYSRELLTLLTTSEYASGYVVIPWLIGAQIYYGSASITNLGMLISMKTGGNSLAAAIATVVNITLSLVLVSFFGIWGAAIGSFVAAIIFTSLLLWLSLRQVDVSFDVPHALGLGLLYVVTSAGLIWIYQYSTNGSVIARTVLLAVALTLVLLFSKRSMGRTAPATAPLC